MSRRELLELLISQMAENETLKKDLERTQTALRDKRIVIQNAGSLADAAVQLSGVFNAAQDAARQYLDNLRLMDEQREETIRTIEAEAREKANGILQEAEAYSRKAHEEADAYWEQVRGRTERMLRKQGEMQSLHPPERKNGP